MSPSTTNNTLYLLGGTGGLGTEVAKGLVTASGYDTKKAIVRDSTTDKAKALGSMGWEVVQVSDMTNSIELEKALIGAKTVVSTFGGTDMVSLETAAIKAAKKVGVTLYVPSQFGVDYNKWGSKFPFLAGKKQVLDVANNEGVATLSVFVGYFSDMIFSFFMDVENAKVTWIGDGTDKISWTKRSDIGYVLAKALETDLGTKGGQMAMQGDYMSFNDATKLLGKSLNKTFTVTYKDPQVALQEEQELLEKGMKGDVGAFFGSFKLHLMGEPARGNTGCDLHDSNYNHFGHKMSTLQDVFESGVYSSS